MQSDQATPLAIGDLVEIKGWGPLSAVRGPQSSFGLVINFDHYESGCWLLVDGIEFQYANYTLGLIQSAS